MLESPMPVTSQTLWGVPGNWFSATIGLTAINWRGSSSCSGSSTHARPGARDAVPAREERTAAPARTKPAAWRKRRSPKSREIIIPEPHATLRSLGHYGPGIGGTLTTEFQRNQDAECPEPPAPPPPHTHFSVRRNGIASRQW